MSRLHTARRTAVLVLTVFAAWAVALGPAALPAAAQEGAPVRGLVHRLPAGTFVVLRIEDTSGARAWLESSPLAALVRDAEVKPLWDEVTALVRGFSAQAQKKTGVDFLDMLDQIRGEMAIALTGLKIGEPVQPGVMVLIDCRDRADAFRKNIDALLQLVPESVFTRTSRELGGVEIQMFLPVQPKSPQDPQDPDGPQIRGRNNPFRILGPIHLAWMDSVIVLTNDRPALDRMIRAGSQDQVATLGETENWKQTMARLGGPGSFTFYVNIRAFAELLDATSGAMPEGAGPVVAALGLDDFPAMASATFLQDDAIRSRFLLRYTGDGKHGLGSLMAFKKADLNVPRWVPEDAWQVLIFNYDFPRAFAGFLDMVKEMGEEVYEDVQDGLEEFDRNFGMSLQNDLFAALSTPVIMVRLTGPGQGPVFTPRTGGLMMGPFGGQGPALWAVKIRNRAAVEKFIEFYEGMGATVTEYLGATILSGPDRGADDPIQVVWEFAITDTHVLIGVGPTSVIRPVLQRMGGREAGFAGVEGVRDALQGMPREGFGLLVYNYGKALAQSLNVMKLIVAASPRAETLARFPVPSAQVLEKYLGYAAGVMNYEPGTGIVIDTTFKLRKE